MFLAKAVNWPPCQACICFQQLHLTLVGVCAGYRWGYAPRKEVVGDTEVGHSSRRHVIVGNWTTKPADFRVHESFHLARINFYTIIVAHVSDSVASCLLLLSDSCMSSVRGAMDGIVPVRKL